MSEQILLLNPRRKPKRRHNRRRARGGRQPAGLRRYWASRRASNPSPRRRRRRARARRSNRRVMHTGRHYRHNPRRQHRRHNRRRIGRRIRARARRYGRAALTRGRGILGGYVIPAVVGGGGALVLDVAWGYLLTTKIVPAQLQTGYGGLAAKLGVVLGAAWLMNRFAPRFRQQTERAAVGAATVLAYGAIKGIAQSVLPSSTPGLSGYIDYQSYALPGARNMAGYMPRTLGSLEDLYSPAAVIQPPGTPVPRQFGSLSGYIAVQPHMSGGSGLMGYDWQNDGM